MDKGVLSTDTYSIWQIQIAMIKFVTIILILVTLSLAVCSSPTQTLSPVPTSSPDPAVLETVSPSSGLPLTTSLPVSTDIPTASPIKELPDNAATPISTHSHPQLLGGSHITDAPDRDLKSLTQRLRPNIKHPLQSIPKHNSVEYAVGSKDLFWIVDLADSGMYQIEAELLLTSAHADWYFQNEHRVTDKDLRIAAQAFEESIYPTMAAHFGAVQSPSAGYTHRITILHSQLRGDLAGYYSASDQYPKAIFPFSNEREIIYMDLNSPIGSEAYMGTLAHELQHAIHWASDPNEETWVNEGLSEVAKGLVGYEMSFTDYFTKVPNTSLTAWTLGNVSALEHYGAASLFIEYLAQHHGGHSNLWKLVVQEEDGIAGINAYLQSLNYEINFRQVFQDWLLANYLDSREVNRYSYAGLNVGVKPTKTIMGQGHHSSTVHQYAGEYVEILLVEASDINISFQGQLETPLLPTSAYSGSYCWWGNRGDSIDSIMTAIIDLSHVSEATLNFWTWYAIEESWDYAYVEVSSNGGETWDILEGRLTSTENPFGTSFGPGYTGRSDGWVEDSIDLTPYAGMEVLLRFEYVTDSAANDDGICIDDISIPEIGYFDDAEKDGRWKAMGFIRTNNSVPQEYSIQIIEIGNPITIHDMPLNTHGRGSMILKGIDADTERVMVIVAPMAIKTNQPSPYTLSVDPVPDRVSR